ATRRRRALRASSYFFPTASDAAILYCGSAYGSASPGGRFGKKFTPDFRTCTLTPGTFTVTCGVALMKSVLGTGVILFFGGAGWPASTASASFIAICMTTGEPLRIAHSCPDWAHAPSSPLYP